MTQELASSYHGVRCVRCGQPTSVSPRIARLQSELQGGDANALGTFMNRCKVCDNENRYRVADVQVFHGELRSISVKARAAAHS